MTPEVDVKMRVLRCESRMIRIRFQWLSVVLLAALLAGCGGSHVVRGSSVSLVIVRSGSTLTAVPDVVGEKAGNAADKLRADGFRVTQTHRAVSGQDRMGVVLSQKPHRGAQVDTGSAVRIVVSR
jgi:hypothetical protein